MRDGELVKSVSKKEARLEKLGYVNHSAVFGKFSSADARDLRYWSKDQLSTLSTFFAELCATWAKEWECGSLATPTAAQIICEPFVDGLDEPLQAWRRLDTVVQEEAGSGAIWLNIKSTERQTAQLLGPQLILEKLFGPESTDRVRLIHGKGSPEISKSVAGQAWNDLLSEFCRPLGVLAGTINANDVFEKEIPAAYRRAWSGAVRLTFPWFGCHMQLHLSGDYVERIVPHRTRKNTFTQAPIVPLVEAIRHHKAVCTVELASVELTIGDMRLLALGDVIVLPHALDDPASIISGSRSELAQVSLGKLRGNRAVELLKSKK